MSTIKVTQPIREIDIYHLLYAEFHNSWSFTEFPNRLISVQSSHPVDSDAIMIVPDVDDIVSRAIDLLVVNCGYNRKKIITRCIGPIKLKKEE